MSTKNLPSNIVWKCLLIFHIMLGIGCSSLTTSKVDQGTIEYTISYPAIAEDSYLLDLLPKKMETHFTNGSFRSDIVAGMGLFKTSIICEKGKKDFTHSVKMLNKKYASSLNLEELKSFNPQFQNISVQPYDSTKIIAGYYCSSALVTVKNDSAWSFVVYYTKDIDIENSNMHTPFKDIDGVLMQYEILSYDTHMRFTAESVSAAEIKDSDIALEDGYTMISPPELKKEIETIFSQVK